MHLKSWITLFAISLILSSCAMLPTDFDRPASYDYTDTADTTFGKSATGLAATHPKKSGFHLMGNGLDAFVARAVLAHHAERSIDVQYYLYHGDLVGRLLTGRKKSSIPQATRAMAVTIRKVGW